MTDVIENTEEREELEARREFLIRSLEDLESERDAGNIDDDTYELLHGDYTARAAAVLRALDGEKVSPTADAPPVSAGRRALIIGAIVAFAIAAAVVLGITISPRLPGQTVTGGAPTTSPQESLAALKQATIDHPNDYSARVAYARVLIGTDLVDALKQYTAAAQIEPNQPEPPTYIGWIYGLSTQGVSDEGQYQQLIDKSLQELATAQRVDPTYADAYAFDGIVRFKFMNDAKRAIPFLEKYIQLAPNGPEISDVRTELRAAQKAAAAPAGAVTTTTGG